AYQVVARVMADLEVLDLARLRTTLLVGRLTVVKAQVVIIAGDWAKDVVPDDFFGDLGVVRIDQRERLAGDEAGQAAMVVGKAYLRGIFLGCVHVWRRPIDALGRYDLQRHPVLDLVIDARRDQFFDLRRVAGGDEVARLHLRGRGRYAEHECERKRCNGHDELRGSVENFIDHLCSSDWVSAPREV